MLISVDFAYLAELDGVVSDQLKKVDELIPCLEALRDEISLASPADEYLVTDALRETKELKDLLIRKQRFIGEVDEDLHAYFWREERIVEETRGLARRLEV